MQGEPASTSTGSGTKLEQAGDGRPRGPEHSELCVNAWSVSMTTDLCCRNEVKCLGQLTPNTTQPSVSQKIGRGMSDISLEAGHQEV